MRRKAFRKPSVGVSLFPFLAVLICTMGALILLLVVTVQQARADAVGAQQQQEQDAATRQERDKELLRQREDEEWKKDLLLAAREETTADLARQRVELSHLEDHMRRLKERLAQLADQAEEIERLGRSRAEGAVETERRLSQIREEIERARRELADAKKRADENRRSFAVVPIAHRNGTLRRPVYLECTADAVIIQPEGIELVATDFEPPLGPANALNVALRAVREYLATRGGADEHGYAYPLLLVRPDGASAYAAARLAMRAWDDEFGYELIDADMEIAYPEANEELAARVKSEIERARRHRIAMASAAPRRYRLSTLGGGDGEYGFGGGDSAVGSDSQGTGGGALGNGALGKGSQGGDAQGDGAQGGDTQGDGAQGEGAREDGQTPGGESEGGPDRDGERTGQPGGRKESQGGGNAGGPSLPTFGAQGGQAEMESMARTKGGNWGLKKGPGQVTGFTRPIRVSCQTDRLVILPELRTRQRLRSTPLTGDRRGDMESFVEQIHEHIESWGIAGPTAYWKPVLNVEVTRGGERPFDELRVLLDGSGIEVKRRQ